MELLPYILLFSAGLLFGLIIHLVAGLLQTKGVDSLMGAIGRGVAAPFSRLRNRFRRKPVAPKAQKEVKQPHAPVTPPVDPREQQISDSAQTIRSILLTLTSVIMRADQAASNASQALIDIKKSINNAGLPPELASAQSLLITEIDRVIANNTMLKNELASSQAVMNTQRSQIEELKTTVRIDGLTQIANRAYFDEKLAEMISLRQRYNDPFSLMMIDADNFKTINDTHGHQAGDRVLKGMVSKIKVVLRKSDFLARFGGDEFALILIKTDIKTATDVAWKVNAAIRTTRFLLGDVELMTTLSIGIAEVRPGETAESLLKRADAALYHAKEAGRNGVYSDGLQDENEPPQPKGR
ncbi:MAG: GGDEF domain-containing protein [Deltaproteobacteria bacterium]|nr:GGDEF domain-containing protein [Deltaproteobacteria bacterium]